MFVLEVNKNLAEIVESEPMTSGSSKVYLVEFHFSPEWENLNKVAVFKAGDTVVDVFLDKSNVCFMPWEVLKKHDVPVKFGVYGTKNGDIVLPTIWSTTDVILEGVVTGAEAQPPSPTLYEQLLAKLEVLDNLGDLIPGGGVDFTTDETLTLQDDVLGVTNPVNDAMSQEEFDALPPEKQNRGLYIIPDQNSSYGYDGVPIGAVISFMCKSAPNGYLICDGKTYSISHYPYLAAFFKQQFGSETYFGGSDGTFAVPDMRNLFLRGYHGEADEQLSGEIGKRQEATRHVYMEEAIGANDQQWLNIYRGSTRIQSSYEDSKDVSKAPIAFSTLTYKGSDALPQFYTSRPVNMSVLYCIKAV